MKMKLENMSVSEFADFLWYLFTHLVQTKPLAFITPLRHDRFTGSLEAFATGLPVILFMTAVFAFLQPLPGALFNGLVRTHWQQPM